MATALLLEVEAFLVGWVTFLRKPLAVRPARRVWQNVGPRVRTVLLPGDALYELGAKRASQRLELSLHLYF